MKFYFTFGLVNQPFTGGWVVINADSRAQACMLFRAAFQPDDEMLNCCSIYEEREFKRTKMYRENDKLIAVKAIRYISIYHIFILSEMR